MKRIAGLGLALTLGVAALSWSQSTPGTKEQNDSASRKRLNTSFDRGFVVEPPAGSAIRNVMDTPPRPRPPRVQLFRPSAFAKPQSNESILRSASQWKLNEAQLYSVLKQIESSYNVYIVGLMSPEKMAEDPKITMILKTGTAEKALSSLGITGLVWRKHQHRGRYQVYTVAWNKKDLNASAIDLSP